MKKFSTWMIVIFMIMFWLFRVVVAFTDSLNIDIGIVPVDSSAEVVLLFISLVSIVLIAKRKMLGGIIYLLTHGIYFGIDIYNNVLLGTNIAYGNAFFSLVGIILPIVAIFDLIFDKAAKANPKDDKTDWFYKNKDYDREFDERADKNNYRTL